MKTRIVERNAFSICGCAVETNLADNNNDISKLYEKFQNEEYDRILKQLPDCEVGYYGLEWYTEGHKSFFYLLGKSVGYTATPPKGAIIKHIPPAKYIVAEIPAETNIVDAWTEFFYKVIPDLGYEVDDQHGYYFEYYTDGLSSACELWSPVKSKEIRGSTT
jgi:AraC family transcriptional regulator